jgi:calcineurin-like phosphoesterase family protein
MHSVLVARWNECVQPSDTIFVLGDLALCPFKQFEPIAAQLNGRKFLIQGNHDHYSIGQYERLGFTVFRELTMKLAGRMVRLSHYPYALPWWKRPFAYKSELRFMDRRPPRIPGEILLHGHTHVKARWGNYGEVMSRIHVGVDAWDFYPASQREIESMMGPKTLLSSA